MAAFAGQLGLGLVAAIVVAASLWAGLALWFQAPGGTIVAGALVAAWAAVTLVSLVGLYAGRTLPFAVHAAVWLAIAIWFAWLPPRADRVWAPDVARPLVAEIAGDSLLLRNFRNFDWRSATEAEPRFETRRYDLALLRTLDVFNSYWTGPAIAHTLVSFGFADGTYLTLSVEIRREAGKDYSNIAGFFKTYELAFVAADERDIVKVRTNFRGEDVRLFRLKLEPPHIRAFLENLLRRANSVAARPAHYHSLLRNCTTELFGAARSVERGLPLDWRVILSGYLPDYLYGLGLLGKRSGLADLRERGRIAERARAAGSDPDFSQLIRRGVPDPNETAAQ